MKLAIVCYPTFGGSGVVATELGIALAQRGHEVHFVTYKQPVRLELLSNNIYFHEVFVPEYPLFHYQPYELALSSKLVDTIKMYDIEVLHVHYAIPHAYAGYMTKKMLKEEGIYIPMITTLHGTDITLVGNHPFYRTAVNFSINKSDVVTAVSESLKQDTLELFDIEKEINVIPNFVDKRKYDHKFKDCKRSLLADDDQKILTHISNFRKVKRIPDVIETFYRVQQEVPAKLIMIGEGPEKENAEFMVEKMGIVDKVMFLGNSNEIDRILCFTDIFLLPSEKESFGLSALEAMVNKVAVISSNTGGIPEVNIHGKTGFLSEVGDVDDMVANTLRLLKDEKLLKKFKKQAFEVACTFDLQEVLPMYEEVYRQAYKWRYKNAFD